MHAWVLVYYKHTPVHSHIPTFLHSNGVCIYMCMMVSSTVSASTTHIYSESERKYVSAM